MKRNRSFWCVPIVTACLFVGSVLAMGADEEHMSHLGKKGTITFQAEMKVGTLTLEPGVYEFQHRAKDSEHVVRFARVRPTGLRSGLTGPREVVAEVPCSLEPLKTKASKTAIYTIDEAGTQRVTKVEVKGEDAVHGFPKQ